MLYKELNKPEEPLRIFCVGQEIEDDEKLSKYNIKNGYAILT